MVYRLNDIEERNRQSFCRREERRFARRRAFLSLMLLSLAFSSSWVVLLAVHAAVPWWVGAVSFCGSAMAAYRALGLATSPVPTTRTPRTTLRPSFDRRMPTERSWIGRSVLPVALILRGS